MLNLLVIRDQVREQPLSRKVLLKNRAGISGPLLCCLRVACDRGAQVSDRIGGLVRGLRRVEVQDSVSEPLPYPRRVGADRNCSYARDLKDAIRDDVLA